MVGRRKGGDEAVGGEAPSPELIASAKLYLESLVSNGSIPQGIRIDDSATKSLAAVAQYLVDTIMQDILADNNGAAMEPDNMQKLVQKNDPWNRLFGAASMCYGTYPHGTLQKDDIDLGPYISRKCDEARVTLTPEGLAMLNYYMSKICRRTVVEAGKLATFDMVLSHESIGTSISLTFPAGQLAKEASEAGANAATG
ncbi:expressed unknown protein [Seminavis robusta]|uniref:Uncharacterized protein n=1 Tax=Seminavis robusta TaxID=568900 RepID=A0A9N8DQQ6_9STRA|nr:expressed unknown protein [Seminavis robusta]|eukprot:Sro189_g081620.1 n/a (198) ;mRNA; f:82134-82727